MGCWRNQREIFHLENNENGNPMYQNLWDTAKQVPRGKFIAIKLTIIKEQKNPDNVKESNDSCWGPRKVRIKYSKSAEAKKW